MLLLYHTVLIRGQPHHHTFTSCPNPIRRTCRLVVTRDGATVTSGIKDMKLMKTTQSGFKGFIQVPRPLHLGTLLSFATKNELCRTNTRP